MSHSALLRASGEHQGERFGLEAVVAGNGAGSGVAHAELLIEFADAMIGAGYPGEVARQKRARQQLLDALGPAALVDAAAVVGSFNAVVKIADATGIPLEDYKAAATTDLRRQLDLDRLRH